MTTQPVLANPERLNHLCDCGRGTRTYQDHNVNGGKYGAPTCAFYIAAQAEWSAWYEAKTLWEARVRKDIKSGRYSRSALDYIAYHHSHGEGEISRQVNYLLKLIKEKT